MKVKKRKRRKREKETVIKSIQNEQIRSLQLFAKTFYKKLESANRKKNGNKRELNNKNKKRQKEKEKKKKFPIEMCSAWALGVITKIIFLYNGCFKRLKV